MDKALADFKPYYDVWALVGSVGPFITSVFRSPVTALDPEEIAVEQSSMKDRWGIFMLLKCGIGDSLRTSRELNRPSRDAVTSYCKRATQNQTGVQLKNR